MNTTLPKLKIVAIADILFHEETDPQRVHYLTKKIQQDGIFINPPIVAQYGKRYILLDGANRANAITLLNYPHMLVQVVKYDAVAVSAWQHIVCGINKDILRERITALIAKNSLTIIKTKIPAAIKNLPSGFLCWIVMQNECYKIKHKAPLLEKIKILNGLTEQYKGEFLIYRIESAVSLKETHARYRDIAAIITFPLFTRADIITIAKNSIKMPSGITRHTFPSRALKINLPLSLLRSTKSLKVKNQKLSDFLQKKLRNNQARLYQEPVWIFDE